MNDCGAKSKLSAPLIYLSKTGNYRYLEEFAMKSTYSWMTCVGLFLGIGLVGLQLGIPRSATSAECSNATLEGAYAYQLSGFEQPTAPFAAVRFVTFDGQGNWSGSGFSSGAGDVQKRTLQGIYTVQPNCEVQFEYDAFRPDGTLITHDVLFGVIVDGGRRVRTLTTQSTIGVGVLLGLFEKVAEGSNQQ